MLDIYKKNTKIPMLASSELFLIYTSISCKHSSPLSHLEVKRITFSFRFHSVGIINSFYCWGLE